MALNVTIEKEILSLPAQVEKAGIRLHALILNAGVAEPSETIGTIKEADILRVIHTNAVAPILITQAFSKHLSETDELSKIVCISSDLGSIALASGLTFGLSYGMSKAALNMGVKRLSRQLGRNNISIVAIHPGWVKTDMGGSNAALSPSQSVSSMLNVIDRLSLAEIGSFVNYQGDHITW